MTMRHAAVNDDDDSDFDFETSKDRATRVMTGIFITSADNRRIDLREDR